MGGQIVDDARFRRFLVDIERGMLDRRRELPIAQRTLHQRILSHFAVTGQAPAPPTIREWTAEFDVDSRVALAALVGADLAEADLDADRVLGAYPFVTESRGHHVEIEGGPTVEAYCALDALGISAMLRRSVTVMSRDPDSGFEVQVQVRGGRATWEPADAVVSVPAMEAGGQGDDPPAADTSCPTVNFYAFPANAHAYERRTGVVLEILTIPQALRAGSAVFGRLLDRGRP
jgi:hypothetical protein